MSRLPTPEQFDEELREVVRVLGRLRKDYRWAYNFGLAPRGSSAFDAVRVTGGSDADQTTQALLDGAKRRVRGATRRVARKVRGVVDTLKAAEDVLDEAFGEWGSTDSDGKKTVTKVELDRLRAAAGRRDDRGEGYGEA